MRIKIYFLPGICDIIGEKQDKLTTTFDEFSIFGQHRPLSHGDQNYCNPCESRTIQILGSLGMDDLSTFGTLGPKRGLSVLAFVLNEHVVGGYFGPAVRAQSERRRVDGGRGHGCLNAVSEGNPQWSTGGGFPVRLTPQRFAGYSRGGVPCEHDGQGHPMHRLGQPPRIPSYIRNNQLSISWGTSGWSIFWAKSI